MTVNRARAPRSPTRSSTPRWTVSASDSPSSPRSGVPREPGDFVIADIRGSIHDEEIPEATGLDLLYEVGSGGLVPKLDEELTGQAGRRHPAVQRDAPGALRRAGRPGGHLPGAGQGGQGEGPAALGRRVREDRVGVRHAGGAPRGHPREARPLKEAQADAAVRDLVLHELDRPDRRRPARHPGRPGDRAPRRGRPGARRAPGRRRWRRRSPRAGWTSWSSARTRGPTRSAPSRPTWSSRRWPARRASGRPEEDLEREIGAARRVAWAGRSRRSARRSRSRARSLIWPVISSERKALDLLVEHANVVSDTPAGHRRRG